MYEMSSHGCLYKGCFSRSWSRKWPMKPIDRPSTKRPLRQPKDMRSSTSFGVKAPHDFNMSTKQTAMQPSTFRMRLARFCCRDLLHTKSKIQNAVVSKVLLGILLNDHNTLIWICQRLDAVSNSHDELVRLLHLIDKVLWRNSGVVCL